MAARKTGQKGYDFEELLRAYFLRAGFYVVRGLPVRFGKDDATDIDIWIYERPTGTARRRQIIDAKFKQKPKAIERLFWTKGLQSLLAVDGAYVATTDKRSSLRQVSRQLGISLIDGIDLDRMRGSDKVLFSDRITEEELVESIKAVDRSRKNKDASELYDEIKNSIAQNFGISLINIALDHFSFAARSCATAHKDSNAARVYGRLSYFCASVAAVALDHLGVEEPFKSSDERRSSLVNGIRYGAKSREVGTEKIRVAAALIREYASNGAVVASSMESRALEEFDKVPAEIIADHVVKMTSTGQLFQSARSLEHWSFSKFLPTFDELESRDKSLLGTFLDFSDVDREAFAESWFTVKDSELARGFSERQAEFQSESEQVKSPGPLFDAKES